MTGVSAHWTDSAGIQLVVALYREERELMEKQRRNTSVVTREVLMSLSLGVVACGGTLS